MAAKTNKLRVIPLGGLGEIGKNMTVYECGKDLIVVDCGMGFPDTDMYGIDAVIPDITYLEENASRIRGLFITHGHEDHIGAVPYVLRRLSGSCRRRSSAWGRRKTAKRRRRRKWPPRWRRSCKQTVSLIDNREFDFDLYLTNPLPLCYTHQIIGRSPRWITA